VKSYLEYDVLVKSLIPAPAAVFALFLLWMAWTPHAYTQAAVAPPTGGIGHAVTGTVPGAAGPVRPPTGTVPNINSPVPSRVNPSSVNPSSANAGSNDSHHHKHHHDAYGPVWLAVPVPYPVEPSVTNNDADDADAEDDSNYQGGPTVFDRRGDGADSYVPPVEDMTPAHRSNRGDDTPDAPPQPTLLVFKDGHKLEVGNYAIIGQTLFDMTPGHVRRVPLAEIDLEATQQQNEEHGVSFQLPMSSQAN
jgi:hypothetical protein